MAFVFLPFFTLSLLGSASFSFSDQSINFNSLSYTPAPEIMSSSSSKMIVLKSSDGKTFEVEELVALESQTIKHMIDDDFSGNGVIFLPNVTSKILSKVIDYCNHHVEAAKSSSSSSSSVEGGDSKSSSSSDDEDHKTFDAEFVKVDYGVLFDLFRAANYLNIKSLHDLTGQTVGGMMKGKTPDEIRKMFNIKNHCTPAETMVEEKFVRENAWAFY